MPFLIGLQASLLPSFKKLPTDEVMIVDLDMGTCQLSTGSLRDDACLLPWSDRLQAALQVCHFRGYQFSLYPYQPPHIRLPTQLCKRTLAHLCLCWSTRAAIAHDSLPFSS